MVQQIKITDKDLSEALEKIPPLSPVVANVLKLIRDPLSPSSKIAQEIAKDPILSFEVMKLVNSPLYGFSRKIETLEHAVALLGMKSLESIIISAQAKNSFDIELKYFRLKRGELSLQAFIGAYTSKLVSQDKWPGVEDVAFTAGVLRVIGKIAMDYFISKNFPEVEAEMKKGESFDKIEKKLFGLTSSDLSSIILEKWKIPEEIREVVSKFNKLHLIKDKSSRLYRLAVSVHIGDRVAMMTGIGASIDSMLYQIDEEIFKNAGIKPEDIEKYLEETLKIYPLLVKELSYILPP